MHTILKTKHRNRSKRYILPAISSTSTKPNPGAVTVAERDDRAPLWAFMYRPVETKPNLISESLLRAGSEERYVEAHATLLTCGT